MILGPTGLRGAYSGLRKRLTSTTIKRWLVGVILIFITSPLLITVYTYTRAGESAHVHAATASTLNFQARLMNSGGSLVTDGSYSVEFKLYTADIGGTNEWTETQTVVVKNGYFNAYLGTVTPFSGTIDWSQEKWLTLNVNGDGEMTPRIKLTAVPYAFRAGQADTLTITGGSVLGDDLLQKAPGALQLISSANAGLRLNQVGGGGLLQLQGDGSDVLTVDKSGNVAAAGSLQIGTGLTLGNSSSTTAGTVRWTGTDFEGYNGASWLSFTSGSAPSSSFGAQTVVKSANQTKTNNTTLQDDPDLQFSVGANETWTFRFVVQANANATPDIKFAVSAPAGSTCSVGVIDGEGAVAVGNLGCGVSSGIITGNTTADVYEVVGTVQTGGTAGTVALQWAQNTTSASAVVVYAGSFLTAVPDSTTSGLWFTQGGNSFGNTAVIGTQDSFGLAFITNNQTRMTIGVDGTATFNGAVAVASGGLSVIGGVDNNAGGITEAGSITGVGTNLSALNGLTIATGNGGDLVLDSSSNVLVLSDAVLRRLAAGATSIELNDASDTTLSIVNTAGSAVANLAVEGGISALNFSGDGASITNLDADNISAGTVNDNRLSSNVTLLDGGQTFTVRPTFSDGLILGNSLSTTAGALRWSGTDFEGYNGIQWVSLTSGGGGGGSGPLSVSLIQAYDAAGGTDLNTGTPASIPWNTETKKDTGFTHSTTVNPSRIYLDDPGWYKVSYSVAGANQGATRNNVFCEVRFNGTTSVIPSGSYAYGRDATDRYTTNTASAFIETTGASEYYEVVCSQAGSTGSHLAVAGQSWTSAEKVTEPTSGSGLAFEQDGNAFGETAILGTTDVQGLNFITNSSTALALASNGDATFTGLAYLSGGANIGNAAGDAFSIFSDSVSLPNGLNFDSDTLVINALDNTIGINNATPSNRLSINTPVTGDNAAQALIATGSGTNKGLVLQRVNGQLANIFEAQNESGQVLTFINQDGVLGLGRASGLNGSLLFHNAANSNTSTLVSGSVTGSRTIQLPDEDGTICLTDSANCGFIKLGEATAQTDSSTDSSIYINKTGASGNILTLQKNGAGVFTILNSGAVEVVGQTKISTDSTVALEVRNATGSISFFTVNTTGSLVQIGSSTPDGTSILHVLDSGTADPTGINGGSYYNSSDQKNRCFEGGSWSDCTTNVVLGETTLGVANGTINIALNRTVEYIHCRIDVKSRSAAGTIPYLRFNNVATAQYGWNIYGITGTTVIDAQGTSATQIALTSAGSTIPFSADINITNFSDTRKAVDWTGVGAEAITAQVNRFSGGGVWGSTTTQITSVQIVASTGTFAAGSHAWCEGRDVR